MRLLDVTPDPDPATSKEAPERLADEMMEIRDEIGLKVLGGCCGTDDRHIAVLVGRLRLGGR